MKFESGEIEWEDQENTKLTEGITGCISQGKPPYRFNCCMKAWGGFAVLLRTLLPSFVRLNRHSPSMSYNTTVREVGNSSLKYSGEKISKLLELRFLLTCSCFSYGCHLHGAIVLMTLERRWNQGWTWDIPMSDGDCLNMVNLFDFLMTNTKPGQYEQILNSVQETNLFQSNSGSILMSTWQSHGAAIRQCNEKAGISMKA